MDWIVLGNLERWELITRNCNECRSHNVFLITSMPCLHSVHFLYSASMLWPFTPAFNPRDTTPCFCHRPKALHLCIQYSTPLNVSSVRECEHASAAWISTLNQPIIVYHQRIFFIQTSMRGEPTITDCCWRSSSHHEDKQGRQKRQPKEPSAPGYTRDFICHAMWRCYHSMVDS